MESPYGRYFCGRRHAMFAPSPSLIGYISWGYPDVDDVRELLRLCEIGIAPRAAPHCFLVDLRGLEVVDPRTFSMFVEYTRKHREVLRRKLLKQAQLRPGGLAGAVISGFSHIARLPYPERVFGDVEEALAWLELEPREGAELIAELDGIRAAASATDETVRRIRELLATTSCRSLDAVAERLALSRRTCQRALSDAGSSFRLELRTARIQRAKDYLSASDRNLSWIAAELGFSSAQHFATAFRRATGSTPSDFRAQAQARAQTTRSTGR